jgi:hypothetical protein
LPNYCWMDEEKATNLFSAVSSDQRLARPRMDVPNVLIPNIMRWSAVQVERSFGTPSQAVRAEEEKRTKDRESLTRDFAVIGLKQRP